MAGVVAIAGCGGHTGKSVKVQALWYGTTAGGKTVGGVTPVGITAATDNPDTPLSVDLRGLRASGAGPMWRAATAVAATQAVLVSGVDPRLQQLKYSLHDAIDGPSAGALLSVGSLAALRGSKISNSTTMTGTVLPDGSIGPVGGIAEKLRAAAAAGFTRVLVPAGITSVLNPRTGKSIDLRRGRPFGVKVTPVQSVPQAYSLMTAQPRHAIERRPPPINPGILQMLTRRSRALIAIAARHMTDLPRGAGAGAKDVTEIGALVRAARRALLRKDPVYAFAASSEAALAGQQAVVAARVRAAARHATLHDLAARIARSARRSQAAIREQVRATAELPVTKIAQLTALSDTLSWGAFALTSIDVAEKQLKTVRTQAQLQEIVRFLETARFEAADYMMACASSLPFLGRHRIRSRTVGLLNAYADLIAYAADANRRYADSLGLRLSTASYLGQLLDGSDDLIGVPVVRRPSEPAARRARALLKLAICRGPRTRRLASRDGPNFVALLATPELILRALRTFGRLVALCAATSAPLLAAGCGGGSRSSASTVTIAAAKQYQRIAGFGVSEGFGQAKTLMNMPASVQKQVLSLLFSPTRGAGLTILRNEISADKGFTIEPRAPSSPNVKPSYLTLAEIDQDQGQLWFAKQIKSAYGASVFADAWSAPGFMKTNNSAINGGTLCGVPGASCKSGDWRHAYAHYLVQYAKEYAAAGAPLTYVGPENEGNLRVAQDSMIMSPAQTANFMAILGATLARSGLSTRAECCASISWNYAQKYAAAIETDQAADTATALFTSHGYFAAPDSPLRGWSKPVWQTEWAPFGFKPWDPAWDDGSPSSGFTWAQNIYTGLTAANLSAFFYLWGASTSSLTGPNTGLVEAKGNTVATSGRLWAFASYSRFIRPGAVRIRATTRRPGLEVSAFRNSDGSTAVIVLNSAHNRQAATFSLRGLDRAHVTPYLTDTTHHLSAQTPITVKNNAFTATLPPRSLVTYDIRS